MSKKVLLVLDWSNLLFRSLFISNVFNTKMVTYDNKEDVNNFVVKFATDICYLLKKFKPSNVVIATDAKNAWRKSVIDTYKINRVKSENINWDNVFEGVNSLRDIMEKKGFHFANVDRCEADDMAAMCKELVFEKYNDYNIIIVSADADLKQLIDFNKITHQYCIVYNTIGKGKGGKRSLFASKDFLDWINEPDVVDIFFSNVDYNKKYIKDLLERESKIELIEENPNDVVLGKIFCGDDGDCVPSFYEWYKNGKKARVTKSKYKKICEELNINNVQDLLARKNDLKECIEKILKKELDDVDVLERLERQRTLVELDSSLFPKNIKDYKDSIYYMIQEIPQIDFNTINQKIILEGTEFENNLVKKTAVEADVFKNIDKYLPDTSAKLW